VDAKGLKLPNLDVSKDVSNEFIKNLDANIRGVKEAAFGVLKRMQEKRLKKVLNNYQVGDWCLWTRKHQGRYICLIQRI
jgi:hypothetical protein